MSCEYIWSENREREGRYEEEKMNRGTRRKEKLLRVFFSAILSLAVKLWAPLHCPSHRKLCGAFPSGPVSISLPLTLPFLTLFSSFVIFLSLPCIFLLLLVSPFSPQPFSLLASLIQFYISLSLSFHISACLSVPSVCPHPSPCHFLWSP